MQRRESREPELVGFIELVKYETLLVTNPLFSRSAIDQRCERSSKGSQQNPNHNIKKLTTCR